MHPVLSNETSLVIIGLGLCLVVMVLVVFALILKRKFDRNEREQTLTPLFSRNNAAISKTGFVATMGLVRFAIYSDFVIVSSFRDTIVNVDDIISVSVNRFMFSEEIKLKYKYKQETRSMKIGVISGTKEAIDIINGLLLKRDSAKSDSTEN